MVLDQRPLVAILHSSNEPGELSQWLCHDDTTINIVVVIIIIIYDTVHVDIFRDHEIDVREVILPANLCGINEAQR